MVLFKTDNPILFIQKIELLESLEDYKIIWQSFYDGIYFKILVDKNNEE